MLKSLRQIKLEPADSNAKVFPGLNAAKGCLILLVILTHCLPNGMLLYFLYFFHMPVFMAISGFLIKAGVFQYGIKSYAERMWHRLLIPWVLACFIYLPLQLGLRTINEVSVMNILYPYYHLWYIPAYLIGAMLCYAVIKWKVPAWPILFVTAAMTVVWFFLYRDNNTPVSQQSLYYLGDKRYYSYLFFFFLGFSLRNGLIKIRVSPGALLSAIAISCSLVVMFAYSALPDYITVVFYMVFNTSLVLFMLLYFAQQNWLQYKLLLTVNKQSLGIYLYHPFIMFGIYQLIGHPDKVDVSKIQGLGVGVLVISIAMLFVWLVRKSPLTSRILLGNIKSK